MSPPCRAPGQNAIVGEQIQPDALNGGDRGCPPEIPCGCAADLPGRTLTRSITTGRVEELFDILRSEWDRLEEMPPPVAQRLLTKLEQISAEDFGLDASESNRLLGTDCKVGYQEVYSGPDLTLCIFVMRAKAHIPLHDHPHMHVFGRLLYGQMQVRSYNPGPVPNDFRSKLPEGTWFGTPCENRVMGPVPATYMLGPGEGNIHELIALEDCAFFDVVVPPYDAEQGRHCTYYTMVEGRVARDPNKASREPFRFLVPSDPGDFSTEPLTYTGPLFEPPKRSPVHVVRSDRRSDHDTETSPDAAAG